MVIYLSSLLQHIKRWIGGERESGSRLTHSQPSIHLSLSLHLLQLNPFQEETLTMERFLLGHTLGIAGCG